MNEAPLFSDMAEGPSDGRAYWLTTDDGVRIRAAAWNVGAARGTVFLLPGRSEYIEKYGRAAGDMAQRGFATLSLDWRGQGLAERALTDPVPGHVGNFAEYQHDLQAMIVLAMHLALPRPWYMIAHSMGGAIGLRALMGTNPFRAVAFSAPMWGILMAAWQRPLAEMVTGLSRMLLFDHRYAPGMGPTNYVTSGPFADNVLTTDAEMWGYMQSHLRAQPELALGGPTLGWLGAALRECADLAALPSPDIPCVTGLGGRERIIDPLPIHSRMEAWPLGRLDLYPQAEHELMMERPAIRGRFFDAAAALFNVHP